MQRGDDLAGFVTIPEPGADGVYDPLKPQTAGCCLDSTADRYPSARSHIVGSFAYQLLLVHPKAVQTGLNNLTAFHTAIWFEGPDYDARVTRQANGRPHRIGQTEPVRLIYPYYADTLQKAALDLVARKITASLQVDGLSLAGALEAAGALSEEDRLHATAALAIGQALYRAATGAAGSR